MDRTAHGRERVLALLFTTLLGACGDPSSGDPSAGNDVPASSPLPVGPVPTTAEPLSPDVFQDPTVPVVSVEDESPPSDDEPEFEPGSDSRLVELFGERCLSSFQDAPVNAVPLSISFDGIPSPVEDTGFELGPYHLEEVEYRHPSDAKFWIGVENDRGEVIGYVQVPQSEPMAPPEELDPDCHPEGAIYDDAGVLIGGFVRGVPMLAETPEVDR